MDTDTGGNCSDVIVNNKKVTSVAPKSLETQLRRAPKPGDTVQCKNSPLVILPFIYK